MRAGFKRSFEQPEWTLQEPITHLVFGLCARWSASSLGSFQFCTASLWTRVSCCIFGNQWLSAWFTTWSWFSSRPWLSSWPWLSTRPRLAAWSWFPAWLQPDRVASFIQNGVWFSSWFQLVTGTPTILKDCTGILRGPTTALGQSIGGCLLLQLGGQFVLVEGSRWSPRWATRHLLLQLGHLHGGVVLQLGLLSQRRQVEGRVNRWGLDWGDEGRRSLHWRGWTRGGDVHPERLVRGQVGRWPDWGPHAHATLPVRAALKVVRVSLLHGHACRSKIHLH